MIGQDVSRNLRFEAAESAIVEAKSVLAVRKELSKTLDALHQSCLKEINELMGSKVNEYLAFRQKVRDRTQEIRSLYTPTREGEKMRIGFKKRTIGESRQFVNDLGIDAVGIRNIRKKYAAEAKSATNKALNLEPAPYVEVTSLDLPKQADTSWTYFLPPYDGSWGDQDSYYTTGYGAWGSHAESPLTAEIGCSTIINIRDTSNWDWGYANALSAVSIWYQMPKTGLIEAWVWLQSIETTYDGSLDDEFWSSNGEIWQISRAYLEVIQPIGPYPRRRYGTLLDYNREDDGEGGSWSGNVTWPGSSLYAHLYSTSSYAAGQLVMLNIGIHDHHECSLDDMSCTSRMTNRWFVKQIALRSTGVT